MNVLLEAKRREISLREVTIQTVYQPGNPTSHYRPLRDTLRIAGELLRFSGASLVSFGVDYSLFCLFSGLTGLVALSNVTARLISAVVNFQLNRRLVFGAQGDGTAQAKRYALLAAAVLGCNTLILKALTLAGLAAPAAKLVTELALFVCSYAVQHRYVFRTEEPPRLEGARGEEKAL
jgi:putative flippase GtrA